MERVYNFPEGTRVSEEIQEASQEDLRKRKGFRDDYKSLSRMVRPDKRFLEVF